MAKRIEYDCGGRHWIMEFNARTVKETQQSGFKTDEIGDKSLIMLPLLFRCAHLMHHRGEKASTFDDILKNFVNKQELFEKLLVMFNEPVEALIDDPEDESVKVNWTASW